MFRLPLKLVFVMMSLLSACGQGVPDGGARIAVVGDSVFAWNTGKGKSISQQLSAITQQPIADFSVTASRMSHPLQLGTVMNIPRQLRPGPYEVILVNGGANDLYFECLCLACGKVIDTLASPNLGGEIPSFLRQLRAQTGAQIVYVGYHRSRGLGGPYERCAAPLDVVESRIARFAARTPGITYVSMQDVFPPASTAHYAIDRIHPSPLGSGAIAARLSGTLQSFGYMGGGARLAQSFPTQVADVTSIETPPSSTDLTASGVGGFVPEHHFSVE